jgi:diadenosine tetraphosphate (Ap4A) HIT family hydrolase
MCAEGRPDRDDSGNRRFFAGADTDAYLHREAPQPGYATVRWRGRHVPDVSEMTDDELSRFRCEIAVVARAMTAVFQPCHLNYDLLGNLVPHVHVHIVPRFLDDPCPNAPLKPWVLHPVDGADLVQQVDRLRAVLLDA